MSQLDIRIALWNSNGLLNHLNEIEIFLNSNNIDILLATETHGTDRTFVKIPGYKYLPANHPSNKAYGGSAIIIKNALNYTECPPETSDAIQSAKIELQCVNERIVIGSVYCRPRFNLKEADFNTLFTQSGDKFIVGGDFNSKHVNFGSRLSSPKGTQLLKSIQTNNLSVLSGGSPTYWPTDPRKVPDLLDFFICKGVSTQNFSIENSYDLSSDHSPVILTYCRALASRCRPRSTNYNKFRESIAAKLPLNIRLKSTNEIDQATDLITRVIMDEVEACTRECVTVRSSSQFSHSIRQQIQEKRKLRSLWQRTRDPRIKAQLNRATKKLKEDLKSARDVDNEIRIKSLTATKMTNYSLWKEIKHIKKPVERKEPIKSANGEWIKSDKDKAAAFKEHLCQVFTPYNDNDDEDDVAEIKNFVDGPLPMCQELPTVTTQEVGFQIRRLNVKKSPGPDGVPARALKNLPRKESLSSRIYLMPFCDSVIFLKNGKQPES